MFSGIIAAIGRITALTPRNDGASTVRLTIEAGALDLADVAIGDSIACNGVCLTVVEMKDTTFSVDVSPETLSCTVGLAAPGAINLEKALRLSDRLGGHLVSGHVDGVGRVVLGSVAAALAPSGQEPAAPVSLVSVMAANNETGVVQDMAAVVGEVRRATGVERPGRPGYVPVHSDVVAALGKTAVDFQGWGLDAMSLSGHKLGAPVGVGALVVRRDLELRPVTGGGGQERGIRSGTQDVVGARALALAVELAVGEREAEAARLGALRDRLLRAVAALDGVHVTLPAGVAHLPSTAHLWFEDAQAEALLMALDMAGIDVSAGSACHAGVAQPSHVMLAMGFEEGPARSTLRCSLGRETSPDDVEHLLAALPAALEGARRAWKATHKTVGEHF